MKNVIKILLIAILSVAFLSANAGKKVKKTAAPQKPAVVLATSNDSISYIAGLANTDGLIPFLISENVDTAYMADFIRGYEQFIASQNDPAFIAYKKGMEIGNMVKDRFIAGISNEMKDTQDSLIVELYNAGFIDGLRKDTTHFKVDAANELFRNHMQALQAEKMEAKYGKNRRDGEAFLAANAQKEGVKTTASGLQYKVIEAGNGPIPTATQRVKVKYEGKLIDGTVFDSSYKRSDPITTFGCNQVIKGWTEALTMMPVGSKWELYIPYQLAYGEQDNGRIPPFSTLIFTVELIGIE